MPLASIFSLIRRFFRTKQLSNAKLLPFLFCQHTVSAVCLCLPLLIFLYLLLRYFTMSTPLCVLRSPNLLTRRPSVCMPIQANWHPMVISHDVARGAKVYNDFCPNFFTTSAVGSWLGCPVASKVFNFTNFFWAAFLYESVLRSFYVLTVRVCYFLV